MYKASYTITLEFSVSLFSPQISNAFGSYFPRVTASDENFNINHVHHHKHPGLGHLTRSVSRVTADLSIASSVSQLFSFLVGCRGMISRGFDFVAFLYVCEPFPSVFIYLNHVVDYFSKGPKLNRLWNHVSAYYAAQELPTENFSARNRPLSLPFPAIRHHFKGSGPRQLTFKH